MEGGDGTAGSVRTQGRRRGLRVGVAVLAAAGLVWFLVVERDQVLAAVDLLVGADPVWIAVGSVSSILSIVVFAAVRSVLVGASGARFPLGRATTASFAAIVLLQIVNVFLCRSTLRSVFSAGLGGNPLIGWGVALEAALL
ncbi:MAG TPA: cation transporting ATPase C-terminal domain-containing protein, partial [Microthrixaceae bacterium]|nr:cation transporting ATPase C-terminal domain-containing protein [Microthrixaceae bacterium]